MRYTILGQACAGDEIKPLSDQELEKYLDSYRKVQTEDRVDESVARDRITMMKNDTRKTLEMLTRVKNITLYNQKFKVADDSRIYDMLEMTTEVIDGSNRQQIIHWWLIAWNGEFRILYASNPQE